MEPGGRGHRDRGGGVPLVLAAGVGVDVGPALDDGHRLGPGASPSGRARHRAPACSVSVTAGGRVRRHDQARSGRRHEGRAAGRARCRRRCPAPAAPRRRSRRCRRSRAPRAPPSRRGRARRTHGCRRGGRRSRRGRGRAGPRSSADSSERIASSGRAGRSRSRMSSLAWASPAALQLGRLGDRRSDREQQLAGRRRRARRRARGRSWISWASGAISGGDGRRGSAASFSIRAGRRPAARSARVTRSSTSRRLARAAIHTSARRAAGSGVGRPSPVRRRGPRRGAVDGPDHVGDRDVGGRPGQEVAALGTPPGLRRSRRCAATPRMFSQEFERGVLGAGEGADR